MTRFRDFVAAVSRIQAAATSLRARLESLHDGRPLVPVVRAAVEQAADELAARVDDETPFEQPVDMIDEEWGQREVVLLRGAVATLGLAAAQRGADFDDWTRDVGLALDEFDTAHAAFSDAVEF